MPNLTTLSQAIAQAVSCDNRFFEHRQDKCWEPSPTLRQFIPPMFSQP